MLTIPSPTAQTGLELSKKPRDRVARAQHRCSFLADCRAQHAPEQGRLMRRAPRDVFGQRALDNRGSQRQAAFYARLGGGRNLAELPVKCGAMYKWCFKIDRQLAEVDAAKLGGVGMKWVDSRSGLTPQTADHVSYPYEKVPVFSLEVLCRQCEPDQDRWIMQCSSRACESGIARSGAVHAVFQGRQERRGGPIRDGVPKRGNHWQTRGVVVAVQPVCIAVHVPRDAQTCVSPANVPCDQPFDIPAHVSGRDVSVQPIQRLCDPDPTHRNHLLSRSLVIRMSGLKFGI